MQFAAVTRLQRALSGRKFNGNAESAFTLKRCLAAFVAFLVFRKFRRLLLLKVEQSRGSIFRLRRAVSTDNLIWGHARKDL